MNVTNSKKTLGKGILVFIFAFLSLLAWSLSTPVGGTPDEDFHLVSIWCGQGARDGYCQDGVTIDERLVPKDLVYSAVCYAFNSEQSAACQRSGYGTESELITTQRGNFTGLYPPFYYWVMSWFVSEDINTSVFVMRMFNTILFLSTLSASSLLLKKNFKQSPSKVALFTLIPLGVFLIPSINPSSWAITACIGAYFATSTWLESNGKYKIASLFVICLMVLMGAGSRADAAIFVSIAITSSFIINASPPQWKSITSYLPIFISVFLSLIFVLPSGQAGVGANGLEGDEKSSLTGITLLIANVLQVPELWAGVFGYWGLGWLDTPMPALIWVLGMFMFGYLYFSGFLASSTRQKITLVALLISLWAIPVVILFRSGLTAGAGVQPRYLLPLLSIIACVAVDQAGSISGLVIPRLQIALFKIFMFMTFTISLFINYRRYESGIDVMSPFLWTHNEWTWPSAPSPMIIWLMGSLSFAGMLILISWTKSKYTNQAEIQKNTA